MPWQEQMKTRRAYLGSQFKMKSFMAGKSRQQEHEAAGYVTSTPKVERKMNVSAQTSAPLPYGQKPYPENGTAQSGKAFMPRSIHPR